MGFVRSLDDENHKPIGKQKLLDSTPITAVKLKIYSHTFAFSCTLPLPLALCSTLYSTLSHNLIFSHALTYVHTHLYTKTPHSNRLWIPLINDSAGRSNLSQNDSRAFRKVFGYMRKSSRRKKATFNGKNH